MTRRRGHRVVLAIALLLVVVQVVAYLIIRPSSEDSDGRTTSAHVIEPVEPISDAAEPVAMVVVADASVVDAASAGEAPSAPDAMTAVVHTEADRTPPAPAVKVPDKPSRAELVLQRQRENRERERRQQEEQQRREDESRRAEIERKRVELEREKAEQARIAADLEKQRLAAERANVEAATAKLAAQRQESDAAKAVETRRPVGSPDVLVLVLGPGVPSVGSEQIRNVYLGRTSVWPNGTDARPMNRSFGTAAAHKFFGAVLGMSGGAFLERWSEIQLGGGGIAPPTISSATALIAKVAATRGGFGYVLESELPENTSGVHIVRLK